MARHNKQDRTIQRLQSQHLNFARRWLGLGSSRKSEVFRAAANALEIKWPDGSKLSGYGLLAHFHQWFKNSPSPHTSVVITSTPRKSRRKFVAPTAGIDPNSDAFLLSFEWRKIRMVVLKKYGATCQCCGATRRDGVRIHVDHIQPRRKHPELALTESNLQVLCEVCNHGKGAWDDTDWRDDSQTSVKAQGLPCNRYGDGDEHLTVRGATFPRLKKGTQENLGNARPTDKATGTDS